MGDVDESETAGGFRNVTKSGFLRNYMVLFTGTAVAQVVALICTPIIARQYTPESIGKLGVYLTIVCIVSPLITLRYDLAVILPDKDEIAANLIAAAMLWATVMSAVLAIAIVSGYLVGIPLIHHNADWLIILPVSCFMCALLQLMYAWSIRRKMFKRNSISQISRSLTLNSCQVTMGTIAPTSFTLIIGNVIGDIVACIALLGQTLKADLRVLVRSISWAAMKRHAAEYRDFPIYNSPQTLLNELSQGTPVLLLSAMFGPAVAGYYSITVRILQMPVSLLAGSLRQVYVQRASESMNSGDAKKLSHNLSRTTLALVVMVTPPVLVVVIWGNGIFTAVLGQQWAPAGELARWLVLWYAAMFVNVPSICTLQVIRLQRFLMLFTTSSTAIRTLVLCLGFVTGRLEQAIAAFSIAGVLLNLYIITAAFNRVKRLELKTGRNDYACTIK